MILLMIFSGLFFCFEPLYAMEGLEDSSIQLAISTNNEQTQKQNVPQATPIIQQLDKFFTADIAQQSFYSETYDRYGKRQISSSIPYIPIGQMSAENAYSDSATLLDQLTLLCYQTGAGIVNVRTILNKTKELTGTLDDLSLYGHCIWIHTPISLYDNVPILLPHSTVPKKDRTLTSYYPLQAFFQGKIDRDTNNITMHKKKQKAWKKKHGNDQWKQYYQHIFTQAERKTKSLAQFTNQQTKVLTTLLSLYKNPLSKEDLARYKTNCVLILVQRIKWMISYLKIASKIQLPKNPLERAKKKKKKKEAK